MQHLRFDHRPFVRLLPALLVLLLWPAVALTGRAADEPAEDKKDQKEPEQMPAPTPLSTVPAPSSGPCLTLWECRQLALQRQPALAAYRASLAFAQARLQAVEDLNVPTLVRPDLPIRRQQAAFGVRIAQAQVHQAEWDTVYAVTRTYVSALYALQQQRLAESSIQESEKFQKNEDAPKWLRNRARVFQSLARARQQEAASGYQRALAGLREALGVGPGECLQVADQALPVLNPAVCREQLIDLALTRRAEIVQAAVAANIVGLEVQAQEALHHPTDPTFAASSDIHAQPVPPAWRDDVYRPGGVAVEMPTTLNGSRDDRVMQAQALSCRANAVVDKTRALITLSVEDAYQRWLSASGQLGPLGNAVKEAGDSAAEIEKLAKANEGTTPTLQDAFNMRVVRRQAEAEYNTALYHSLLALVALERETAGGFCPGLDKVLSSRGFAGPATPATTSTSTQDSNSNKGENNGQNKDSSPR